MADGRRVVLITGAASGIGAALARRLAAPSDALVLATRGNDTGLAAVADAARAKGSAVETILADLTDPASGATLVSAAIARFGRLDAVVANAGFADRTEFAALDEAGYAGSAAAIGAGFFRLASAAIPQLGQGGRIVAVSSFVAHVFRRHVQAFPASAAAKASVEAMVKSLAYELGPRGVTVNAVAPGFIRKDPGSHRAMPPERLAAVEAEIPLGRVGEPDDVAAAIAFLLSAEAGYITGQVLHVSGGLVI
ncbi:SDR family NAD(P)-dependent oxidoreductase [Elioraea rosea]|uniref:SDR family NAD(P)-dependent oxidoreductase n=1 Tax=Elioraea rosea TaxID=2492390 RepID=UPI0011831FE2|nr:SDR family oxidoreductase [Elioraea rosea]